MPRPPPMLRYVSLKPSSLIFLMKSVMMNAASRKMFTWVDRGFSEKVDRILLVTSEW